MFFASAIAPVHVPCQIHSRIGIGSRRLEFVPARSEVEQRCRIGRSGARARGRGGRNLCNRLFNCPQRVAGNQAPRPAIQPFRLGMPDDGTPLGQWSADLHGEQRARHDVLRHAVKRRELQLPEHRHRTGSPRRRRLSFHDRSPRHSIRRSQATVARRWVTTSGGCSRRGSREVG